jgi:hypothetical protein
VGHNGTRLNTTDATAQNLAAAFDIQIAAENDGNPFTQAWEFTGNIAANVNNWMSTGWRMNRTTAGDFTVGGRASGGSFSGKIASTVVTTFMRDQTMPDTTEIEEMTLNPLGWLEDYKIGNDFRKPGNGTNNSNFQLDNYTAITSTQVWLMGDGTSDAYARIRNQVYDTDQNYTALNMVSMVANDIHTVSITGLT